MAPFCADPRQIVTVLDPAQLAALLQLVDDIASHMITQLQSPANDPAPTTPSESHQNKGLDVAEADLPMENSKDDPPPPPLPPRTASGETPLSETSIRLAAIAHMQSWKEDCLTRLTETINTDHKVDLKSAEPTSKGSSTETQADVLDENSTADELSSLAELYHPLPTALGTMPLQKRQMTVSCLLVLLLSTGKYTAHSRVLLLYLSSSLHLTQTFLNREETEVAMSLIESSRRPEAMSADAEAAKRRQRNKVSRIWKVGLASVAGAAVVGVTGGLAAPLVAGAIGGIMGGIGLGGVAGFLSIFWMNSALVGALFGAYGARMTGEMMDKYAKEVDDFQFVPLDTHNDDGDVEARRRLRVTIGINGWLTSEADIQKPWQVLGPDTEVFALRYEMKTLLALGSAMQDLVHSFAWKTLQSELIKRTALATLWAALWPIQVLAVASKIDNPFSRARNRSQKAGRLLADALINKVQGERPVTLIGYSLGAVAVDACLQSLARRQAFGLVSTAVLIGAPAPSEAPHWRALRPAVSGKIFNVYSTNDMILGYVYRAHSFKLAVAGLQPIHQVEGVHNIDLSERVSGHLRYPSLIGEILSACCFVDLNKTAIMEEKDASTSKDQHLGGQASIEAS